MAEEIAFQRTVQTAPGGVTNEIWPMDAEDEDGDGNGDDQRPLTETPPDVRALNLSPNWGELEIPGQFAVQ